LGSGYGLNDEMQGGQNRHSAFRIRESHLFLRLGELDLVH